jgi:hypothetical protein
MLNWTLLRKCSSCSLASHILASFSEMLSSLRIKKNAYWELTQDCKELDLVDQQILLKDIL